jgi:hypothetical protein
MINQGILAQICDTWFRDDNRPGFVCVHGTIITDLGLCTTSFSDVSWWQRYHDKNCTTQCNLCLDLQTHVFHEDGSRNERASFQWDDRWL